MEKYMPIKAYSSLVIKEKLSEKMFTMTHSPVIFKPSVLKLGLFLGSFSGVYKVKETRSMFSVPDSRSY